MTFAETTQIAAMVRMLWPHSRMDPRTPDVWHPFLERFALVDVEDAVRELAATGREHAPVVGLIAKTVAERASDLPDWDEAWEEVARLIRRYGSYRLPPAEAFTHPLIAAFARPSWGELCKGPAPGTRDHGMHYAQQREAFRAMRTRAERGAALDAVGAPRRRGELTRLEPLAALPAGNDQEAA